MNGWIRLPIAQPITSLSNLQYRVRWAQQSLAPPSSCPSPVPLPVVPTSEDVDSELSRPRLFFPGGLLLVLKESLLPAEGGESEKEVRG